MNENQNEKPRFLSMDIVFYGRSLNYDQGSGNYQELKKITMYDGSIHTMVSRYALRYSILETGKVSGFWNLAGPGKLSTEESSDEETTEEGQQEDENQNNSAEPENQSKKGNGNVVQIKIDLLKDKSVKDFPEFDFFGYLCTQEGKQISRTAPVKISHAISLSPYNFDSHFSANLGIAKRARKSPTEPVRPDPVNIEEFHGFYVYNVTIDLERCGKFETDELVGANEPIPVNDKKERIEKLLKAIFYLKRDIKGRREDLSPWLVIVGAYKDCAYDTYMDRISLAKEYETEIIRGEEVLEKAEDGKPTKIRTTHYEIKKNGPHFIINDLKKEDLENNKKMIYARSGIKISLQGNGKKETIEKNIQRDKDAFISSILTLAKISSENSSEKPKGGASGS